MNLCIFEDTSFSNFLPLVYFRPVYHLRCGITSLEGKIRAAFPGIRIILHSRPYLADYLRELDPATTVNTFPDADTWFINGRVVVDKEFAGAIKKNGSKEIVLRNGGDIAAAFLTKKTLSSLRSTLSSGPIDNACFANIPSKEIECRMMRYPWDIVHRTAEQIGVDLKAGAVRKSRKQIAGKVYPGVHLLNKKQIWLGKNSTIKPGAVLDAEKGPIVVGEGVTIMSNVVIEGPTFVGDHSTIKVGAKIYHGTSIGEWCKMGGEVETAVVQSFSNKQHEGFLGHAYLGSWVNIGADTNNSDLKNNYGNVKVLLNGVEVDTGMQFVGLTMGDHSKTGINCMFDTGTVIGVSCNIYGAGLPPKFIPSFSWGSKESMTSYNLEKSLETAQRVMARRNIAWTPVYERLYRHVHTLANQERTSSKQGKAGADGGNTIAPVRVKQ